MSRWRSERDLDSAWGINEVRRDNGLSHESLYQAVSETGNPGSATVLKMARALGVKLRAQAT
ncbi:DNA-binding protein [Methyloversatilis sp. XJ19-13]|uniref:helix-turn-helix domain-containing transcriptional regulator n=1 Tax=Methyloversatilis sp. XJ19-13 TaxID=2963430 RepID=UPI0035934BFF